MEGSKKNLYYFSQEEKESRLVCLRVPCELVARRIGMEGSRDRSVLFKPCLLAPYFKGLPSPHGEKTDVSGLSINVYPKVLIFSRPNQDSPELLEGCPELRVLFNSLHFYTELFW